MLPIRFDIRSANHNDLDDINHVIEEAIMTWELPERVKRLSLTSYMYTNLDFDHLEMVVAQDDRQSIIGLAAWEQADAKDTPSGHTALALHGIYVNPSHHHQGIGRQLFRHAQQAVRKHHYDGLLVKAQNYAKGFFISQGMTRLPVENPMRQFANRFWKSADE